MLVASKGGDDRDPDWYRNLVADPNVELTVAGTTRPMLARTADAAERAELWPVVVQAYDGLRRLPAAHHPGDPGGRSSRPADAAPADARVVRPEARVP